jgi:SAM-dependent methyltransferase
VIQGDAEVLPFPDGSFDVVVNEYGAAIWCDPHRWIPEASRVIRPGGELVFLGNGAILMLCVPDLEADDPADERLKRDYFGMHRFEWPDDDSLEFHLGYGDWPACCARTASRSSTLSRSGPRPMPRPVSRL